MRKNILLIPLSIILFLTLSEIILRIAWYQKKSDKFFALEKVYIKLWYDYHYFYQENFISDIEALDGIVLNKKIWNSSFTEVGLSIPPRGPREGFQAKRVMPKNKFPGLRFIEPETSLDTLLEINKNGVQFSMNYDVSKVKILILGGSVAFSSNASSIYKTYYEILSRLLSSDFTEVGIATLAAFGWTSYDELNAFTTIGSELHPDYLILLDGLNDLTGLGGGDQNQIKNYNNNVKKIYLIANLYGIKTILAPQPFFEFRKFPTKYEKRIKELYPEYNLIEKYSILLRELKETSKRNKIELIDCSSIFNLEQHTVFVDYWHFSDYGQNKLAHFLALNLNLIIKNRGLQRISKNME